MAVKVDKDFIIKHRFWILTGVFVILALVPLFLLTTSVSATVAAARDGYDKAKKAVEGINGSVPNQSFVDAYTVQDKFVADKKAAVHKEAWLAQKSMVTYPAALTPIAKDMWFGDDLGFLDLDKFSREYKTQLADAVMGVKPLLPQEGFENGVVQFAGNSINGVLNLAVEFNNLPPTKEDFWLAQEDLWVKRELLRVISDANDSVAHFYATDEEKPTTVKKPEQTEQPKPADPAAAPEAKPAEGATPAPAEKPAPKPVVAKKPIDYSHRVFRNQHWELDLTVKPGQDEKKQPIYTVGGTIKNIGNRRRALGIVFKVLTQPGPDAAGMLLPVDREPLGVQESWQIPAMPFSAQQVAFEGLYGVEEVLTWRTAPVKRIDVVALEYPSSRMASRTLKPPRWYTPPAAEDPAAAGGEAPGGPGGFGAKMKGMGGGDAPGGPGMAGMAAAPMSKNGLNLNRYIDANEQVRHMPVGMVVIADEEHLAELLSAFSNSRLRIQVTQCHWQVCRDKMSPLSPDSAGPATLGAPPRMAGKFGKGMGGEEGGGRRNNNGMFRGPGAGMGLAGLGGGKLSLPGMPGGGGPPQGMPNFMRGRGMMPGGPGGMAMGTGMGPGGRSFGAMGEDDEEENLNLLEVAVYGVASLYEKFPPKQPAQDGGATPDGATAPGSPAPGQVGIAK